jgi:GNAT superfamily N-acetyltransferase
MPVDGYTMRTATERDLTVVLHHRRRMFEDMGYRDVVALDRMTASSAALLGASLRERNYRGWLVELDGAGVVAGGGLISLEFQPHPVNAGSRRSWIVNMFTEPEHRRRGLARWIVETIVAWCRDSGLPGVYLHASDDGRGLYASLGFEPTSEMRLDLTKV